MSLKPFIVPEKPEHATLVEELQKREFGPGAVTRAAFRLREQGPHDPNLSYVAVKDGALIASVRMTSVVSASGHIGYLLGPLVVSGDWQNAGFGRALVAHAVSEAGAAGNADYVILVGDAPYYGPLGFTVVKAGAVQLPGPVDPRRLLVHPLHKFDPGQLSGSIRYAPR